MTRTPDATTRRPPAATLRHLTVIAMIVLLAMYVSSTVSLAQQAPIGLGTADSFAVLAGETITNKDSTTITGDVGLHPGSEVTGFDEADPLGTVTLEGSRHLANAVALQAKDDLETAYIDAAGRTSTTDPGTELGGQTLPGGVYSSGTFGITEKLTLDAEGDPDTVWVFQAGTTLITETGSSVSLINGADPCNVFWQVGTSATLKVGSSFTGTIMALTSITLESGATVEGRALARNGAVTMDTNTITRPTCTPSNGDNGDNGENGDNGDNGENGENGENGNGVTPPGDDDAAPPTTVQPPTRIDAGAGGTAPPESRPGVLLLLAVAVVGTAVVLLRRVTNSG